MAGSVLQKKLTQGHWDHFIFGHRHLPLEIELDQNSRYTNLGIGLYILRTLFLMEKY